MFRVLKVALIAICVCLRPLPASGEAELSLDDVLTLARQRAPVILSARRQIDEARGHLIGASRLLRDNPTLALAAGPRQRAGGSSTTDVEVGLGQTFELGGRRGARIAAANAQLEREVAHAGDTTQGLLREVAAAYLNAVAAAERLQLAQTNETVAIDLNHSAELRHRSGDIAKLDFNLTATALARARSDRHAAAAAHKDAIGRLHRLLALPAEASLPLRRDLRPQRAYDLDELLGHAAQRADLQELAAEIRNAEADAQLGKGMAWPDLGMGVQYKRDDKDDITLGSLSLSLPVSARGSAEVAVANARASRLRFDLEARQHNVDSEVRTALDVYRTQLAAVDEIEREALARLDENERLSRRSFEVGQLSLADLLLIRRETVDTRRAYVDRLLAAALAAVDLEYTAGVLR